MYVEDFHTDRVGADARKRFEQHVSRGEKGWQVECSAHQHLCAATSADPFHGAPGEE
jgi:hypothetical protein